MKDAALITFHGMGKEDLDYYVPLMERLRKELGSDVADRISFQHVNYARILQEPQNKLWEAIEKEQNNKVAWTPLRQFLLFGFGDAGALENSAHRNPAQYLRVQETIQEALDRAYIELGEDKTKPVIIVAHSLGCQVISNYLWDAYKGTHIFMRSDGIDPDRLAFLKLKSMRHLVSSGCNIPLFVGGLVKPECFELPNHAMKWHNYYDPHDVLGWPLRQLGDSFRFIDDYPIDVGGLILSRTPLSHLKYWTDNNFVRPLARVVEGML